MVYESGYTTRRTYTTSRPVVTSYTVSVPTITKTSRVYKTSYPIYSSYSAPRRFLGGSTRVITSPIRVVSSPVRIVSSPVRVVTSPVRVMTSPTRMITTTTRVVRSPSPVNVVRTTTRVVTSPERTLYSSYVSPRYTTSYEPLSYNSFYKPSYTSTYTTPSYIYSSPSYLYTAPVVSRVQRRSVSPEQAPVTTRVSPQTSYLRRDMPGYGARALTNYLSTEPYETFRAETDRIRQRAQSLVRDLMAPVVKRAQSNAPFGVGYEPTSKTTLDSYVSRITDPTRHIAKEVRNIVNYGKPAKRFTGKSHLASVKICGDKAYEVRRPMYEKQREKVRTDINLMSWYLRHPQGKSVKKVIKDTEKIVKDESPIVSNVPAAVEVEA